MKENSYIVLAKSTLKITKSNVPAIQYVMTLFA